MDVSVSYVLGFVVGLLITMGFFIISSLVRKNKGKPCEYDERQLLARGKAYKAAFFVLIVYLLVEGSFKLVTGIEWADSMTRSFIGICLSVTVFAIICILNDAYLSLKEKPAHCIAVFSLIAFVNLAVVLANYFLKVSFLSEGMLNYHIINFIILIMFAVIMVVFIGKLLHDKKTEKME